jgi:apolipoprotein N-acyltransferase
LVPGVEKQPYAKYLKIVNNLAIDLGGAVGSFGTQAESAVFPAPWNSRPSDTTPAPLYIGVAICYESAYGEYFASYVKKGAGIMSVITNDGWWGKTPGYRQHLSYSRLRAIETRLGIARSANTGISALINQRGDYLQKSEWWTKDYLRGEININHKLTFYVRYGDLIGRVSVYLLVLLLLYWLVISRPSKKIT